MDSLVLETVIGLIFVFAVFSALVSVLTEAIARLIGLRGEYLLRGVRSLLDGPGQFELRWQDLLSRTSDKPKPTPEEPDNPLCERVLADEFIARTADKGLMPDHAGNAKLSVKERRRLPSYISGRSFARGLIGVLTDEAAQARGAADANLWIGKLPEGPLRQQLLILATEADGDLHAFRTAIEQWYDDHMARVSGWYKNHVRWITLGLAAVVVCAFNLNAVGFAQSLYTDEALRASVVTQATQASDCKDKEPAECLQTLREEISSAQGAGLPIGWGVVPACELEGAACTSLERYGLGDAADGAGALADLNAFLLVLLGWALMVVATIPGARFWFDALSRLGSLRATGPKPTTTS